MSLKLDLGFGLVAVVAFSMLAFGVAENSQAQLFRTNSNCYCPPQVRMVRPACPTVQYYVLDQPYIQSMPAVSAARIQYEAAPIEYDSPAAITFNMPIDSNSGPAIEGVVENAVVYPEQIQTSVSDVIANGRSIVEPVIYVEPTPEADSTPTLEPVLRANDTLIVEPETAPTAADPPQPDAPATGEPTPASDNSILDGN